MSRKEEAQPARAVVTVVSVVSSYLRRLVAEGVARGETRAEIARRIGTTPTNLRHYVAGRQGVPAWTLDGIATYKGIGTAALFAELADEAHRLRSERLPDGGIAAPDVAAAVTRARGRRQS